VTVKRSFIVKPPNNLILHLKRFDTCHGTNENNSVRNDDGRYHSHNSHSRHVARRIDVDGLPFDVPPILDLSPCCCNTTSLDVSNCDVNNDMKDGIDDVDTLMPVETRGGVDSDVIIGGDCSGIGGGVIRDDNSRLAISSSCQECMRYCLRGAIVHVMDDHQQQEEEGVEKGDENGGHYLTYVRVDHTRRDNKTGKCYVDDKCNGLEEGSSYDSIDKGNDDNKGSWYAFDDGQVKGPFHDSSSECNDAMVLKPTVKRGGLLGMFGGENGKGQERRKRGPNINLEVNDGTKKSGHRFSTVLLYTRLLPLKSSHDELHGNVSDSCYS